MQRPDQRRAPPALTVTVNSASKVYAQPNPAFGVSYNGFVNGDTASGKWAVASRSPRRQLPIATWALTTSPRAGSPRATTPSHTTVGSLSISPAGQTIAWSDPAAITYGTPLGAAQLNATVTGRGPARAGTLNYSSPVGTVLVAGVEQTLTVVAAATLDYTQAMASVSINVGPLR